MHAPNREMHVVDTQRAQTACTGVAALQKDTCKSICCTDTVLEIFLSNITFHAKGEESAICAFIRTYNLVALLLCLVCDIHGLHLSAFMFILCLVYVCVLGEEAKHPGSTVSQAASRQAGLSHRPPG